MKKSKKAQFWQAWWFKMVVLPVIIMPIVVLSWKNITLIWAAPEKLNEVVQQVDKQQTAQEQVAQLILEEKSRNDKQDAVYQAQMASVKEQLKLIAELKGKK